MPEQTARYIGKEIEKKLDISVVADGTGAIDLPWSLRGGQTAEILANALVDALVEKCQFAHGKKITCFFVAFKCLFIVTCEDIDPNPTRSLYQLRANLLFADDGQDEKIYMDTLREIRQIFGEISMQ